MTKTEFRKTYRWLLRKYPDVKNVYGKDGFVATKICFEKHGDDWIATKQEKKTWSFEQYCNTFDAVPFFENLGGTEAIRTERIKPFGRIPVLVASVSPDGESMIEWAFDLSGLE